MMRMMHDAPSVSDMTSVLKLRLQVRQERGSEIVYFAVCRKLEKPLLNEFNSGQEPRGWRHYISALPRSFLGAIWVLGWGWCKR